MFFTQAQLRSAVGLGPEAVRHWRKVLPYLMNRRGRALQFTFGDLLALAIIREITEVLGVPIGKIGSASEGLFEICNSAPAHGLERCSVVFDGAKFLICRPNQFFMADVSVAIIPVELTMKKLREKLFENQVADDQASFLFPPTALRG